MSGKIGEMALEDRIEFAVERCRANSFNRAYFSVDLPFDELLLSLLKYLNRVKAKNVGEQLSQSELFEAVMEKVPEFQRSNDKWTPKMQSAYVRNVLLGMKSPPILLYSLDGGRSNCGLMDGLQRLTSFYRFFTEPEMVIDFEGSELTAGEILASLTFKNIMMNLVVPVRIYDFDEEAHVVEHYIEINEYITHSPEDIDKARRYWLSLVS